MKASALAIAFGAMAILLGACQSTASTENSVGAKPLEYLADYESEAQLAAFFDKFEAPLIVVGKRVYLPLTPCIEARIRGMDDAGRLIGSDDAGRLTGTDDAVRLTGLDEAGRSTGLDDSARLTGIEDAARDTGQEDDARMVGQDEDTRNTGLEDAARLTGMDDAGRKTGLDDSARLTGVDDSLRSTGEEDAGRMVGEEAMTVKCLPLGGKGGFTIYGIPNKAVVYVYDGYQGYYRLKGQIVYF